MLVEARTAPAVESAPHMFDFSRSVPATPAPVTPAKVDFILTDGLDAGRPDPEAGWAARNPDKALLFLYITPRDCAALDELLAL